MYSLWAPIVLVMQGQVAGRPLSLRVGDRGSVEGPHRRLIGGPSPSLGRSRAVVRWCRLLER